MTVYFCKKDNAHIPYYSDGSNEEKLVNWICLHAPHRQLVRFEEFETDAVETMKDLIGIDLTATPLQRRRTS